MMSAEHALLPPAFAALEPFVAEWALPTTAERAERRGGSSAEARKAFYVAMNPLAAAAITALDAKPLSDLDAEENRLMNMLLAFAHVSLAVEIQGDAEAKHTPWRNRMTITQAPADRAG